MTAGFNFGSVLRLVLVVFLLTTALGLAVLVKLPGWVLMSLTILGGTLFLVLRSNRGESGAGSALLLRIAALASVPVWWSVGFGDHARDHYYGGLAELVALALAVPEQRWSPQCRIFSWRGLSLAWGLVGLWVFLVVAYRDNEALVFFASLVGLLSLLVVAKLGLRLPAVAIQGVNTLIIVIPGLCLADVVLFPAEHAKRVPTPAERAYSFAAFQRDPAAFVRWIDFINRESSAMYQQMFVMSPSGARQPVLRSNITVRLAEKEIAINNFGFRGRDISAAKGRTYRIVTLGESTTFGITVDAQSRPWSELLEELIRERLHPDRPIEVINAGIPSVTLHDNLQRLRWQILPLQPDLIISYHGYNQFTAIDGALPPVRTRIPPPQYVARPLELLAKVEYRWRLQRYTRLVAPEVTAPALGEIDLLKTSYADDYRELIQVCREQGVRLALGTYSLAVNERSDPEVQAFHHRLVHSLKRQMRANAAHAQIVRELVRQNPEVDLVETQPTLDGQYDCYIDLVHFTPEGEQRMAEAVFAGIKETLKRELAQPSSSAPSP